ncbi:MAG: glycosyltransferase family 2 protein [Kiritimatiellae bacterium]|nr:glycosyltransferase family 2 protein [Kiritimatiellia bacterium]
MKSKKVIAIILNWNGLDFTKKCCESLAKLNNASDLRIIVVDNGSTAHSFDELVAGCPNAEIIESGSNLGFAGGNGFGFDYIQNKGYDYDAIWLLNNDTECEPYALESLLDALYSNQQCGVAGCDMIQSAGAMAGKVVSGGQMMSFPLYTPFLPKPGGKYDYLCGASLLIRREVIEQVGLLDKDFFFFFEDAEFSHRVKKAGWQLSIAKGTPIRHYGSAAIGSQAYNKVYNYRRGQMLYIKKCAFGTVFYRVLFLVLGIFLYAMKGQREAFRANTRACTERFK